MKCVSGPTGARDLWCYERPKPEVHRGSKGVGPAAAADDFQEPKRKQRIRDVLEKRLTKITRAHTTIGESPV